MRGLSSPGLQSSEGSTGAERSSFEMVHSRAYMQKEMATHSSILAWRIPWTCSCPWGRRELDATE